MIILGIDLGLRAGWCSFDTDTRAYSLGFVAFECLKPADKRGLPARRLVSATDACMELIEDFQPGEIIVESVPFHRSFASHHAALAYALGLLALETAAYRNGLELIRTPAATVKKHATGKGNANKAAMIDAAHAHHEGTRATTDPNAIDAFWVAHWRANTPRVNETA